MEADSIFRRRVFASRIYPSTLGRFLDFELAAIPFDPTVSLRSLVNQQHTTVSHIETWAECFSILFPTQMAKDEKDR